MIRRTGLAPWEFEFPFPGSLTSTLLGWHENGQDTVVQQALKKLTNMLDQLIKPKRSHGPDRSCGVVSL